MKYAAIASAVDEVAIAADAAGIAIAATVVIAAIAVRNAAQSVANAAAASAVSAAVTGTATVIGIATVIVPPQPSKNLLRQNPYQRRRSVAMSGPQVSEPKANSVAAATTRDGASVATTANAVKTVIVAARLTRPHPMHPPQLPRLHLQRRVHRRRPQLQRPLRLLPEPMANRSPRRSRAA